MRWSPRKGKSAAVDAEALSDLRSMPDRLYPGLFAYLYRLIGDWDLAQDLARDAFVRLSVRSLPRPQDRRARLYRIATELACRAREACGRPAWQRRLTQAALRMQRRKARSAGRLGSLIRPHEDRREEAPAAAAPPDWGRSGPLEAGLASLSFGDRAALLLCYHHGFGLAEAAAALGTNPGQVARRLARGRAALRAAYASTGSQGSPAAAFAAGDDASNAYNASNPSDLSDSSNPPDPRQPVLHARISALLDRDAELDPAARGQAEAHAATCSTCARRMELDARITRELAGLIDPWPSHRSREVLRRALLQPAAQQETAPEPRRRRWPVLAAVAFVIVGLLTGGAFWLVGLATSSQAARPETSAFPTPLAPAINRLQPTPTPGKTRPGSVSAIPGEAVSWLQQNAIPITTTQPGGSAADLAPLRDMIGSARVVALADSAYGTHELAGMRQRVLEYLVNDLGFRALGVETASPEGEILDDFVAGEPRDGEDLMLQMTGGFRQTQETLDALHWLRTQARSPYGARVQVRGFDIMQVYSHFPHDAIVEYLKQVDPTGLERVNGSDADLLNYLQAHRDEYIARSSSAAYSRAMRSARALIQYGEYAQASDGDFQASLRVQAMLQNVSSLLRSAGTGGRAILWGGVADLGVDPARQNLGARLRDRYGKDYVVIDLAFYQGALSAATARPGITPGEFAIQRVAPAPAGSYEDFFAQAGLPRFMLDLRSIPRADIGPSGPLSAPAPGAASTAGRAPSAPALAWFQAPHDTRTVEAEYSQCYPEDYFSPVRLHEAFDAVIYVQDVSAATKLFQLPVASTEACPAEPQNLDFSDGTQGWSKAGTARGAYIIGVHPAGEDGTPARGYVRPPRPEPSGTGSLMQAFRADDYRGKRVHLSTRVMANDTDGEAYLWLRIEGVGARRLVYAIRSIPNGDPRPQGIVVDVPPDATRISFGIEMQSRGEVWLSDVHFDVVGQDVPVSAQYQ